MTADEFIGRLEGVRTNGCGKLARCPSHKDRTPSLSVKCGERGILVKCWAGCTIEEIVLAMGLKVSDLFFHRGHLSQSRKALGTSPPINLNDTAFQFRLHGSLLFLRSHGVLNAAKHIDVTSWTDAQLDQAMQAVAKAHNDLSHADLLEEVAFGLRLRILRKGIKHAA